MTAETIISRLNQEGATYVCESGTGRGPWKRTSGSDHIPKGFQKLRKGQRVGPDFIAWEVLISKLDPTWAIGRWRTCEELRNEGGVDLIGRRLGDAGLICLVGMRVCGPKVVRGKEKGCAFCNGCLRCVAMNGKYILDESGTPKLEHNLGAWAAWFENNEARRVAKDQIGDSTISTMFLGLDHSFTEGAPPVLWETMVFGGKLSEEQDRCSGLRADAEAMHARMVERVRNES